ncbi:MAG: hypothetical protein Q8N63_01945 [Nanoarchaeota archaeon]|nr:hypothetical protein [Nanoarchaeota archaeon]
MVVKQMVVKQKVPKQRVTEREVEKEKMQILFQKMSEASYSLASSLNPHVESYCLQLSQKFDEFLFDHIKRARNGFGDQPLYNQLQELSAIRTEIDEIAGIDNPNHPFIGVARELADRTFDTARDIYKPFLNTHVLAY